MAGSPLSYTLCLERLTEDRGKLITFDHRSCPTLPLDTTSEDLMRPWLKDIIYSFYNERFYSLKCDECQTTMGQGRDSSLPSLYIDIHGYSQSHFSLAWVSIACNSLVCEQAVGLAHKKMVRSTPKPQWVPANGESVSRDEGYDYIRDHTESRCQVCGTEGRRFKCCGQCRMRRYCGPVCQRKDWPTHKTVCQPRAKEKQQQEDTKELNVL
jgi:hypothetical protein